MFKNYFKTGWRNSIKNKEGSQMYFAKWKISSVKRNFFLPFSFCTLLISTIIFSFTACKHQNRHWKINTAWEKLIVQERSQPNSITKVDNSVIAYMKKYNVPGLSLAITKDDKLIYVKSYGFADVATQEKVTNKNLFRLASVSKPITAIAIMKLIQDGKLSLNSKIFGDSGILGDDYGSSFYSSSVTSITIDELLHHTCGGWPDDDNDPMFHNSSYSSSKLISWTLKNQSLNDPPGTAYAYSNFGYFLLGRVIEKVTGQRYENYVNSTILHSAGIIDMQIGGNSKAAKKHNEVVYYDEGDGPYIVNLSRMDAAAGWIATATDLLRLMTSVDGSNLKKTILDSSTVRTMLKGSAANPRYACGWELSDKLDNWFHFGEIMGTATLLAHTTTGFSWAILTNTGYQNEQNGSDLDQVLWNAINDSATQWPDKDLF